MRDRFSVPATHCGEELRRIVAERHRRRRRLALAALISCATVPLAGSILWKPPTLLVWNASASAPVGLYRVSPGAPVCRGDVVVARTPEPARSLAARRHYLPANVPLVKRVAAVAGDRVCAAGSIVSINGRQVAKRQASDPTGRPMPRWSGCRLLRQDEFMLLMDNPLSFDGRYFGMTRSGDILGPAKLLWAR